MLVDFDFVSLTGACYPKSRLVELYDRPYTPLEILTNKQGPWANVPAADRLWTILRDGVLDRKEVILFSCDCLEQLAVERSDILEKLPTIRTFPDEKVLRDIRQFARGTEWNRNWYESITFNCLGIIIDLFDPITRSERACRISIETAVMTNFDRDKQVAWWIKRLGG